MPKTSITTDIPSVMSTKHEPLEPIQGVLEILNRASMTGTHKLGLLLVLLDLAPESVEGDHRISMCRLTHRYLEIHWEHGRPYGDIVLRQTSSRKKRSDGSIADDATVMQEIYRLRSFLARAGRGTIRDSPFRLVRYRMENVEKNQEWNDILQESITQIEKGLWKNPIRLLQRLPGNPHPFLFEPERPKGSIRFLNNVPKVLTQFSGVLRPLIEFRFSERVIWINKQGTLSSQQGIHTHLFERNRIMPPTPMKRELAKLQGGGCIFTGEPLRRDSLSPDHIIPWSRHRLSQVENFVITTRKINNRKSDSLLGPDMVNRWLCHIFRNCEAMREIAQRYGWPSDLNHVIQVAMRIFVAVVPGTGVWHGERGVHPLGVDGRRSVIEMLRNGLSFASGRASDDAEST